MELNVVYSSDENYCKHLYVSLLSLLTYNREFSKINVYIIENNISTENKEMLENIDKTNLLRVEFIDFELIQKKVKTDGKFPLSAFGRLFLDSVINKERVLYFDCDSVVNGSLKELYCTDLGDNICGAVQDNVSSYYKESIGLKSNDIYFNSGMVLMDLKKWKQENMQQKAVEMIEKFQGSVPHHDQGVLNAICYNKILRLHPKYNFQCPMFEYKPRELRIMIPNYYSEQEIREAVENPIFIHYTEGFSNRPWREECTHPYAGLYRNFQKQTPYAGYIEHQSINKNSEIMYKAYLVLPFSVYRVFCYLVKKIKMIKDRR